TSSSPSSGCSTMTDLQTSPRAAAEPASGSGASSLELRPRPRHLVRRTVKHIVMIAASLAMIYPLLWMVVSSLRPNDEIFRNPANYEARWNALAQPFSHYIINSTVLVLGCVIGNLVACSLTAYAFARLRFWGRNIAFAVMLMTLMLPIHVVIVPQYILFSQTG